MYMMVSSDGQIVSLVPIFNARAKKSMFSLHSLFWVYVFMFFENYFVNQHRYFQIQTRTGRCSLDSLWEFNFFSPSTQKCLIEIKSIHNRQR